MQPGGKVQVTKWRTLGRISHEQTLVMADQKTVYASDDHPNGGGSRPLFGTSRRRRRPPGPASA